MENKESGIARPSGICEKLFNALHLNPTFGPLRRIGYHPHGSVAAAAATPATPSPVPSPTANAPPPPIRSSGLEYPGGVVGSPHQSAVPERKAPPEARLSKVESESVPVPWKTSSMIEPPAAAAAIPSKKLSYVESQPLPPSRLPTEKASDAAAAAIKVPQPPPPSRLPTEKASSNGSIKVPAPAPTPVQPPEKVVSKVDDIKASVDGANPPAAVDTSRTRTRKNLNEKVDEYINRTINRMRTSSNVGPSSSKGRSE